MGASCWGKMARRGRVRTLVGRGAHEALGGSAWDPRRLARPARKECLLANFTLALLAQLIIADMGALCLSK
jgi:hypothetical protein